ncbi:glycosyltransferase [Lysobacter sp. A286]
MKFSIITASYNQSLFLRRSLESVQKQTYRNFEHLIHDGQSTDGSQEILNQYAANNSNASLIIERDGGQVEAINNGLRRASGEILTWLNTDDFLFDETVLQEVANAFRDDSVDVVYGRGWYVDTNGERIRDVYVNRNITSKRDVVDKIGVFQPALFFRRKIVDRIGLLDRRYQLTLDYEYWIRLLAEGVRFKFIDRFLAKATLHSDSKTCGLRTRQLAETLLLVKDRFGYVHPDWMKRLQEHVVNNNDWTAAYGQGAAVGSSIDIPEICESSSLTHLSFDLLGRLSRGKALKNLGHADFQGSRVIATSFNDKYFAQGLNLVASIHVNCRNSIDAIIVYDLGMTPAQISILEKMQGVIIEKYPKTEPWDGYFHPKAYVYKCYAIQDARKHLTGDGEVLWIDAGVCVTSSLEEIFDIIEERGIFLINHDDRKNKTLVNASFTHPNQVSAMSLSPEDLGDEHVCSCVVGYQVGSIGESLVDRAYQLSLKKDLNAYSKHPQWKWQNSLLFDRTHNIEISVANSASAGYAPLAALARYPYYGHRQDQSLYSNLASLMSCPVDSAARFCPATDYSSSISLENWKSNGEYSEIKRSQTLPEGFSSPLFHHRGTYSNLCGLRVASEELISSQVAMVLGNGPSLKEVPFEKLKGVATIGMNAAYRYWDSVGWYPTYYCCMDTVVIASHAKEIKNLIDNQDLYGIRLFFLRRTILDIYPELEFARSIIFLEDVRPLCPLFQVEPITTGSYSLLFLVFLGFREIHIAGVDCNYVERVEGAESGDAKNRLVITADVNHNPNYFFDGYQQKGDEFNIPNPSKDLHVRSWRNANAAIIEQKSRLGDVKVFNLNIDSRVDCFDNGSWSDTLLRIYESSERMAKTIVRDLQMTPEMRQSANSEIGRAVFSAITGSKSYPSPSVFKALPRNAEIGISRRPINDSRVEFRLESPFKVKEQEVLGAAFIIFGLPSPLKITLLNIKAWETSPVLEFASWGDFESAQQNKQKAIYPVMLDENTGLVLVSARARTATEFVGLGIDVPGVEVHIESVQCIGVTVCKPIVCDELSPGVGRVVASEENISTPEDANSFHQALFLFRCGEYERSFQISALLAKNRPDFKWYAKLADANSRKLAGITNCT